MQAKKDGNYVSTLLGVSSVDGVTPVTLYADPVTHALIASVPSGAGTVTSVSVVSANGISGSVATPTTTPAITLTLGAITPTTVNGLTLAAQAIGFTIAGGVVSKTLTVPLDASVSGTNTGDQTNISGNAATASAIAIVDDVATNATMYPTWVTTNTGNLPVKVSSTKLSFNPSTGTLTPIILSANSVNITGTAGAGFVTLVAQSSNPTSPAAGTLLIHSSTTQGFTRMEQDNEATTNLIYGRDNVFIAKNTSGGNFTAGQPVYVTGATGNVPNIALARANSLTTLPVVGITLDPILNNAFGQVMVLGIINNINTNSFNVGDALYVSTSVAGALQNTRPSGTSGAYVAKVGEVIVKGIGNGSILVDIAPFIGNLESGTTAATWTGNAVVGSSFNNLTITNNGTNTLNIAAGKTLTVSDSTTLANASITLANTKALTLSDSTTLNTNAITLAGGEVITFSASNALSLLTTGTTVMTFPAVTDTVAVLGTAQTYTATQTEKQVVWSNNAITATGNAATVPITSRLNTVTNNSAATLTITMTTTSAVDGQLSEVRILDASAVAQTITWVNTEDSTVTAPTTSNGSTTLPLSVLFQYNGGTSKWRCIAKA